MKYKTDLKWSAIEAILHQIAKKLPGGEIRVDIRNLDTSLHYDNLRIPFASNGNLRYNVLPSLRNLKKEIDLHRDYDGEPVYELAIRDEEVNFPQGHGTVKHRTTFEEVAAKMEGIN